MHSSPGNEMLQSRSFWGSQADLLSSLRKNGTDMWISQKWWSEKRRRLIQTWVSPRDAEQKMNSCIEPPYKVSFKFSMTESRRVQDKIIFCIINREDKVVRPRRAAMVEMN